MHAEQIETLIKEKSHRRRHDSQSAVRRGALKKGVEKIHMIGGHIQHCLLLEIFTNAGIGTKSFPEREPKVKSCQPGTARLD